MSLLIWNEKYTVGVTEFDDQHKKLIVLINSLHDAMKGGHGKEVLKDILNELNEYTIYHFDNEERYFAKFNYPSRIEHVKEHVVFKKTVSDLKKKSDEGKMIFTIDLMNFLKKWLLDHIQGTDKKYGPYLNAKGLH